MKANGLPEWKCPKCGSYLNHLNSCVNCGYTLPNSDDELDERIVKMYRAGGRVKEIMDELKINPRRLYKALKKKRVKLRYRKR